jgi:hypothetical protein
MIPQRMKKLRRSPPAAASARVRMPIWGWKSSSFKTRRIIRNTLQKGRYEFIVKNTEESRELSQKRCKKGWEVEQLQSAEGHPKHAAGRIKNVS